MSSARDRQRAAARARLEREMAARAQSARRRRLMQARIGGGVAGAFLLGAIVWIIAAMAGGSEPAKSGGPVTCDWAMDPGAFVSAPPAPTPAGSAGSPAASPATPAPTAVPRPGIKDVGTPGNPVASTGFQVLTIDTNLGVIKIEVDLAKTPCTGANLAYLASKKFYDGSSCHRLVKEIAALQCGDPSGTGSGGATYRVRDENLPVNKLPAYHEGDVAMANTGQPGTNGSQFFFLYGTSTLGANYSLFGHVIEGMEIVKKVGGGGDDGAFANDAGGGHPKIKLTFKSVTAGPISNESQIKPSPTPSSAATPSAGASPSP